MASEPLDLEETIHAKAQGYAFGREDWGHLTEAQINALVSLAVRDVCAQEGRPGAAQVGEAAAHLLRELAARIYSDPAHLENITCYAVSREANEAYVHLTDGRWEARPIAEVMGVVLARSVACFAALSKSNCIRIAEADPAGFVPWSVLIQESVRACETDPAIMARLVGPEGDIRSILEQNMNYLRATGRIQRRGPAPRPKAPPPLLLLAEDPSPFEGPFLAAAKGGRTKDALELLARIPNPWNARSPHGESALHWAAANDDVDLIKALARRGCSPNISNYRGTRPLYYSAEKGAGRACEALLTIGADSRHKCANGYPEQVAKDEGLRACLRGARFRIETPISKNPTLQLMYRICRWGHDTLDKRLLESHQTSIEWAPKWAPRPDLAAELPVPKVAETLAGEWGKFQARIDDYQAGGFDPSRVCAYCGASGPGKQRCSRCRAVWFCGPECQRPAWTLHKSLGCEPAT